MGLSYDIDPANPFGHAVEFVEDTVRLIYSNTDVDQASARFHGDATWIGAGDAEFFSSAQDIADYLDERAKNAPRCLVSDIDLRVVSRSEDSCIVAGHYWVRTDPDEETLLQEHQRCSCELVLSGGAYKIRHLHASNPYQVMGGELYFPNNMSKESRSYLEQVVREKTGIIDTVTANIVCGVKASNDDETYSYRYVNESLPRMLGYTMEEFLEASDGSAGGLVYEEDKDRAFADCARCFAEGDTYISEYRVRKKDGSLIWVYDSGRKALDEDGSIRINSVLMDITSRKEAEEALAVEQERFRIALRSLVDTMFEYDIEHDTLTKYLRGEGSSEEMPAEETIDRYLERLETGQYVHLDDIGAMKDALLHGTDSGVDVRQRSREDAEWLWTRMTCSIYEDINGKATRTIGCWRDVDEERRTHDHLVREAQRDPLTQLFNLRTAAEMIDAHLGACRAEGLGALLLLDIDDFKGINDSYGHLAGNVVLAALAQDLDRLFSRKGVVARLGGDEFLVFLPQAAEQDAVKAADEVLGLSAANASRDYPASISIGIGLVSRSLGKAARAGAAQDGGAAADQASTCSLYRSILDGDAASAALSRLLESADSALYRAKRAGKGRASL